MKIIFDHEIEELDKLFAEAKIEDKGDVALTDDEIKAILDSFANNIQHFDIGTLVVYLGLKINADITKLSILIETVTNDLGWETFTKFAGVLQGTIEQNIKAQEEAKAKAEAEATESAE